MKLPPPKPLKSVDIWYDKENEYYHIKDKLTGRDILISAHEVICHIQTFLIRNRRKESDLLDGEFWEIIEQIYLEKRKPELNALAMILR